MTYRELLIDVKNLDDEIDLSLLNKDKEKKAYIYLTDQKNKKIYIDGDTCYEVSLMIPGYFSFSESQKIIELLFDKNWRMPTREELNLIYRNLKVTGQILDKEYYWSSTSYKEDFAWCQYFGDGGQVEQSKDYHEKVCAIRSFKKEALEKDIEKSLSKFTREALDYICKENKFNSEIEQEIRRRLSLGEKMIVLQPIRKYQNDRQ